LEFQQHSYDFETDAFIKSYLLGLQEQRQDELFKLSRQIEPPELTKEAEKVLTSPNLVQSRRKRMQKPNEDEIDLTKTLIIE